MARKPNYRADRMERERAKAAKKARRAEARAEKSEARAVKSTPADEPGIDNIDNAEDSGENPGEDAAND